MNDRVSCFRCILRGRSGRLGSFKVPHNFRWLWGMSGDLKDSMVHGCACFSLQMAFKSQSFNVKNLCIFLCE